MNVYSLCEPAIWDKADWYGTMFAHDQSGDSPPLMGLMFRDIEAGKAIFRSFRERVGISDKAGLIQVSIVEGEIPRERPGYTVVIGVDVEKAIALDKAAGASASEYVAILTRFHRMNPLPGSPYLPTFKSELAKHRQYRLLPTGGTLPQLEPILELAIDKYAVNFKRAEYLDPQDLEYCVFKNSGNAPQS